MEAHLGVTHVKTEIKMLFAFEETPHNSLNCKLVTSILSANQEKRRLKVAKAA